MNSKEYIDEHDFGYGTNNNVKKLHLRNIDDLNAYINDVLSSQLIASVENNVIYLNNCVKKIIITQG